MVWMGTDGLTGLVAGLGWGWCRRAPRLHSSRGMAHFTRQGEQNTLPELSQLAEIELKLLLLRPFNGLFSMTTWVPER